MREIKFRGWDTIKKKMYFGEDLWMKNIVLSPDGRGLVELHSGRNCGDWVFRESIIPLEFTGLKDKNGNEIYEDDHLQEGGGCIWRVISGEGKYILREISHGDMLDCNRFNTERSKIIGNHYVYTGKHKKVQKNAKRSSD